MDIGDVETHREALLLAAETADKVMAHSCNEY